MFNISLFSSIQELGAQINMDVPFFQFDMMRNGPQKKIKQSEDAQQASKGDEEETTFPGCGAHLSGPFQPPKGSKSPCPRSKAKVRTSIRFPFASLGLCART